MSENIIDPDFKIGPDMHNKPLKTEALMKLVKKESPFIQGKFRNKGYITGNDYWFVNMANFDLEKNSIVDASVYPNVAKSNEEKIIAQDNVLAIEQYFKSCITTKDIEVKFLHGRQNSYQCALVNIAKKFSAESENELYEFLNS